LHIVAWLAFLGSVILVVTVVTPLEAAAPNVLLQDMTLGACNQLAFGFVTTSGHERKLGSKKDVCETVQPHDKKISVDVTDGSQLWLEDVTCGTIYYSDGSGDANHAKITDLGGGQLQIDIADGGGSCEYNIVDHVPSQGTGNLSLIYDTNPLDYPDVGDRRPAV
jgi:hypothetical protein